MNYLLVYIFVCRRSTGEATVERTEQVSQHTQTYLQTASFHFKEQQGAHPVLPARKERRQALCCR